MCILPNFKSADLEKLRRTAKKGNDEAEAESVELIVPEQQLLENSI
jgi:hypothetical protein